MDADGTFGVGALMGVAVPDPGAGELFVGLACGLTKIEVRPGVDKVSPALCAAATAGPISSVGVTSVPEAMVLLSGEEAEGDTITGGAVVPLSPASSRCFSGSFEGGLPSTVGIAGGKTSVVD